MKKIYTLLAALSFAIGLIAQPSTSGLIARYNFNNGNMNDVSGNNHTLTNVGVTGTTDPANNQGAVRFNGSSYLTADNMGTMPSSFTISMWVRPFQTQMLNQAGTNPTLLNLGGDINVCFAEQGTIYYNLGLWSPSTNGGLGFQTNVRIDDSDWMLLTYTWDAPTNTFKMYANGSHLVYSGTYNFTHGQRTPTNKLTIGVGLTETGGIDANSYFNGDIDQVFIYDRVLQNFEMNAIYYEITPAASVPYFIVTPENADNHACEGGTYQSFAFANGHGNVSMEWLKNGFQFGQPSSDLYLSPLTFADNASYYCQATNGLGTQFSEQFSLTVDTAIAITTSIPDTTYICSTSTTGEVSLSIATNTATTSIGWYINTNESPFSVINSATANVSNGDAISVQVSGECGYDYATTYIVLTQIVAPSIAFTNNSLIATGGNYDSIEWLLNGTQVAANTTSFLPVQNGDYVAVVHRGNCTETSNSVNVILGGVAENELGQINLYPNPAQGKLFIKTENNKPGTSVAIYNTQGILLSQTNVTGLNTEVNIENLAAGYYFVKVNTTKGSSVIPFVKM